MKLISWNVNGLRACCDKGFRDAFTFCLQETKMQAGQLDLAFDGYTSYWNYAEKKGYSGTAIFTRHQPLNVSYGMGIDEHDREGRVITLEMLFSNGLYPQLAGRTEAPGLPDDVGGCLPPVPLGA